MRAFLIGLGLSNQIQADYCNLNGESDHNQPIDSCFCPSAPLVHIAAQKADLNLLKKLKESDCELNIRNKNGNNALLFAAQSKSPYEVTKYLVDQNCELIQYNKGNIQPIHVILSDKSQAATASEIIETMYVYRVNGLSSDEPSRPVYDIAIMDYKMQLPNYFISYSPIEFLNQNTRLSDSDKLRIVDAMQNPMHSVIEKISSKSRTQLLEGFEEKRKTELEARQAVIDDLREELKVKNVEFLNESKKLQQALENHKDAHSDTVAQFDRLKLQFEKEVDRHANAETQFSEENLKLKRELDELKLSMDEKFKIAADEKTRIISDHSDEIENMKKYQDARELSTKKEIQKLQEEVERMGKEETSFHLNIENLSMELETSRTNLRNCQTEQDNRDESHLEEKKTGEEKISENLETIATLESSLSAVQSELENQKDVTAGLREKVGALSNEKQLLLSSNEHCTKELSECQNDQPEP